MNDFTSTVIFRALCFLREIDVKQFRALAGRRRIEPGSAASAVRRAPLQQSCRRWRRPAAAQKRAAQVGLPLPRSCRVPCCRKCRPGGRPPAKSLSPGSVAAAAASAARKRLLLAQGDLDLRAQLLQLLCPRQAPGLRRVLHILPKIPASSTGTTVGPARHGRSRAAQNGSPRIGTQRIEQSPPSKNPGAHFHSPVGRDTDAAPGRDQRPYRLTGAQRQIVPTFSTSAPHQYLSTR